MTYVQTLFSYSIFKSTSITTFLEMQARVSVQFPLFPQIHRLPMFKEFVYIVTQDS